MFETHNSEPLRLDVKHRTVAPPLVICHVPPPGCDSPCVPPDRFNAAGAETIFRQSVNFDP